MISVPGKDLIVANSQVWAGTKTKRCKDTLAKTQAVVTKQTPKLLSTMV